MKRSVPGLIVLFVFVYLLPLNVRQLAVPDEMRYGEISREMLASGNFVVPRLNGLRYFEKPAGGHVLNALAMAVFGKTNFAVRLMSSLAAGLTAFGLYFFVRRYHAKQTAAMAAFIFLTSAEVMATGTFSVLDSMLTCFTTLSLCCFYPALSTSGKSRLGLLALSGVFAGGAFLVKGFLAFAVPVVVIVPYLMVRRQWKELFTLPWIPLAVAGLVSLPWSLAVAAQEPDFWRYFFWEEHVRRFFSSEQAQHAAPFWFYVPVLILGTIPWSFIGPLPLRDLVRYRRHDPLMQFGFSWLLMPFLFFSCSSGKLQTYILPCFAPFAMLTAAALTDRFERGQENRSLQTGVYLAGVIAVGSMAMSLVVTGLYLLDRLPLLDAHFLPKAIGWLAGLSIMIWLIVVAARERRGWRKAVLLGLSFPVLFMTATCCSPTEIAISLGTQGVLESEKHRIGPATILVATSQTMHAVCYVYERDDVCVFRDTGELTYGFTDAEVQHRKLDASGLDALLRERGARPVAVVIKSLPDDPIREQLPAPSYQRQWRNTWFAVFEPQTES